MKNKTHPHHKLIDEWCMNMETELEEYSDTDKEGVSIDTVLNDTYGNRKFRVKPREFVKGHWYPCVTNDSIKILVEFNGLSFGYNGLLDSGLIKKSDIYWIGESLGEVKFPI